MTNQYLTFPVVTTTDRENALSFGDILPAQYLPPLKNYAKDEKIAQAVANELLPVVDQTRRNRQTMENEWADIDKMVRLQHGSGRRYFGRSDTVLPVYRRERDKLISMLSRGLFPSDEYFDCIDKGTGDPEVAKPTKIYMQWELERNANLRRFIKPVLGSLVDYGTAPLKFWYRKEVRAEGFRQKMPLPIPGMGNMMPKMRGVAREGLAVSPRPLKYWYIYPETCESIDDASIIFEDIDVSMDFVERMKASGLWENVEQAMFSDNMPDHTLRRLEVLANAGMSDGAKDLGKYGMFPTVTEIWTFMQLPRSEYMEWEDPDAPVPVHIVVANGTPLLVRRNPFFHQRPPYVVGRLNSPAGMFYGLSMGGTMAALQTLSTDFMNQTNDNGIMALNPVTLINPGLMVGPPRPFAPGVPWYVSDVQGAVRFERPPTEQVGLGISIAQMLINMARDMGGAPPDQSRQSGGAKTATGMQILQKNTVVPLQDSVEDLEVEMMVPLLFNAWKNAVQYRESEVMAAVARQRVLVQPEMLAIDADFEWVASSQAVNNQVRSQQAMSLIQMMAPLVPLFAQQGYVVDFSALVRKVYVEGFGFRGFDQFVYKGQAMQGGMGPPSPGQMAGVQAEQGDRMRSAMEQTGGGMEAQPGEAEDFMEVRANADDIAGQMGGGVGGGLF